MPKYNFLFCVLIAVLINTACGTKPQLMTIKPEPEEAAPLVYDNTPSFLK